MALRIVASRPDPAIVSLPWDTPLEEWDELRRTPAARPLPPRRPDHAHCPSATYAVKETVEEIALPRVPPAPRPAPDGSAGRRAAGRGHRPGRQGGEELPAALMTEHLRFSLPYRSLFCARAQGREPAVAHRRAGGAAGPAAPRRLLLGRRVAVERAVPAQRRRVRGVPRRRGDRRAQADAVDQHARVRHHRGLRERLRRAARPPGQRLARPPGAGRTRSSSCWRSGTTRCGPS